MRKSRFSEEQIIHCPAVHCVAMSRVWTPPGLQAIFWLWQQHCGRVPSCIRPLVATFNAAGPHGEFEEQVQNERP